MITFNIDIFETIKKTQLERELLNLFDFGFPRSENVAI